MPRAAHCLRFEIFRKRFLLLHFDPLSHVIYVLVHNVFRRQLLLARMRAFDGSSQIHDNLLFYLRHIYRVYEQEVILKSISL